MEVGVTHGTVVQWGSGKDEAAVGFERGSGG